MTIFVAGATGNVGSQLVSILAGGDHPVRALVREGREASLPSGVEAVVGDLNRTDSFDHALQGVDGAFLLSGYEQQEQTLQALKRGGAQRVVLLSSGSIPGEPGNAVTRYHAEAEAAVEASGLAWTHLRPTSFASNALRWLPQLAEGDLVREPFGDVPSAVIDPSDVAAVAAQALRSGDQDRTALYLSGPESLLPAQRVAILGELLGRPLRFEETPDDEARAQMLEAMPEDYVDAFFRFSRGGTLDESVVRATVEAVTGRPPRSFEQWARANAASFAG